MKKVVASLMVSCALMSGAPVFAQAQAPDPAAVTAARELFDAMKYRDVMTGLMQQMAQGMAQSMRAGAEASIKNNPKTTPEQKQALMAKMEAELPAELAKMRAVMTDPGLVDEMMTEIVPLYARNFTADELKQIAVFYRSPVGVKTLATMPQLMGEAMQLGQKVVLHRIQALQKAQQGQQAPQ